MARPGNASGIAREDQSTIRCDKENARLLRIIAAKEDTTVFDLVNTLLSEYIQRYRKLDPTFEAWVTGRPVSERAAAGPVAGRKRAR